MSWLAEGSDQPGIWEEELSLLRRLDAVRRQYDRRQLILGDKKIVEAITQINHSASLLKALLNYAEGAK